MKVKVVCLMFVQRHAMLVYGQINEAGSEAGGRAQACQSFMSVLLSTCHMLEMYLNLNMNYE